MISRRLITILCVFFLVCTSHTEEKDYTFGFGYPLFNPQYISTPLDAGSYYSLQPMKLATSKVENVGDLFFPEPGIYHPDLVTAGRPVYLSSYANGLRGTRVFWRGRPLRDMRTGRSDLNLLPIANIGGLRAESWGALNGAIATGAAIDIQPLDIQIDEPLTFLTHQDGYYDFGPVEFLHSRPVAQRTQFTAGGLVPASWGRFEHSVYKGHILYGQVSKTIANSDQLSISCLSSLNKTEIPFTELTNTRNRSDFDAEYIHHFENAIKLSLQAYHSESITKLDSLDDYGRETGISARLFKGDFGGYFRASRLDGNLPLDAKYDLIEIETSAGWSKRIDLYRLYGLIGGYGWAPVRIRPVFSAGIEADVSALNTAFIQIKQAADPHSPEMMYAEYRAARPFDDYQPVWRTRPELPLIGADKPVTIQQSGRIGLRRKVPYGEVEVSGFASNDINPVIWSVKHDSLITLTNLAKRYSYGWQGSWIFTNDPFRTSLSVTGIDFHEESGVSQPLTFHEPDFRLSWETGWHRSFWDDYFEADISLSGKYFSSFYAYESDSIGWQKIGGAYPLDVRFSFRIQRFNFYYGLHNWNSYQYFLVPGYKMIHKEEYWGVNWVLLN
ncbi:hypothetical protein K9N50_10255 [bacterium]|nr:hypothetical protein [bacterium]